MKLIIIAAVLGAGVSSARAECRSEDEAKPVTARMEMINGKPTMVIDKQIIICGHPARPAVVYVTSPKQIDWAWQGLDVSFVPRIVDALKDAALGGSR